MDEKDGGIIQYLDGVPCRLRQEADFGWLAAYGRVCRVWDGHLSGNLCFGVEGPYGRLFIKYAGAWTVNSSIPPSRAVRTLAAAMAVYGFRHPSMIPLLACGPVGGGFAAVFPWLDAPPLSEAEERARRLPLETQLRMLDGIFDLHAYLAENGYVSVDFHDGHVLVDFEGGRALLSDADMYRRKPAFNDRGRMYGSSRFLAPEEYDLGAPLDECTVVYHMGALAFAFFGDNQERSRKKWIGPGTLYAVAERACRERREERHPAVRAFLDAWREAVGRLFR